MSEKTNVARLSIISNLFLTLGKLLVGITINSVSIISEAIHSGMDLMASLIAFFSVRQSGKPADHQHQYGHGKYENVAGITEALLIMGAGIIIICNSYVRLTTGSVEIHTLDLGLVIMALSVIMNIYVSRRLFAVGEQTESPALIADGWHLRTDIFTSLGVLAGIAAIRFTGLTILDPVIAIGVALLIIKTGIKLTVESLSSILDAKLPETDERIIEEVMQVYSSEFVEFHKLRTRRAGPERYVDLHLVLPAHLAVNHAHAISHRIEDEISQRLAHVHVLIHAEPCEQNCSECIQSCTKWRVLNN